MTAIIGDLGGESGALFRLIQKLPKGRRVFVGDLPDRGNGTPEIINWAMSQTDDVFLMGNHEHMMVDFCDGVKKYHPADWLVNGGLQTLISYGFEPKEELVIWEGRMQCHVLNKAVSEPAKHFAEMNVPKAHVEWLRKRPYFYEEPGLYVSHAPWPSNTKLGEIPEPRGFSEMAHPDLALWNRSAPRKREGVLQVFGHNSAEWNLKWFDDWAVCIDDTKHHRKLTALIWPSREIIQESFG